MVGTLSTREGLDFKFAVLDIVPCADKGGGTACLSMELLNPAFFAFPLPLEPTGMVNNDRNVLLFTDSGHQLRSWYPALVRRSVNKQGMIPRMGLHVGSRSA